MNIDNLETDYWFSGIAFILIYNLIIIIIVELCRRDKRFQIIFCCAIIPPLPTYIYFNTFTPIEWVKLFSIIIMIIISIIIRYYKKHELLFWILYSLFLFHIIESFLITQTFHLNIISAIILIMCTNLPLPSTKTIFISHQATYNTLNYKLSLFYIITYTIWNYTFSLNYKCYEHLLTDTLYLFVPIYFLLHHHIKHSKPHCCTANVSSFKIISEWFFLRLYALLMWSYINGLPDYILKSIPFWNIISCNHTSVSDPILWIINIFSVLCSLGLLIQQIYSVLNAKPIQISPQMFTVPSHEVPNELKITVNIPMSPYTVLNTPISPISQNTPSATPTLKPYRSIGGIRINASETQTNNSVRNVNNSVNYQGVNKDMNTPSSGKQEHNHEINTENENKINVVRDVTPTVNINESASTVSFVQLLIQKCISVKYNNDK
eukprot:339159_1